MRTYKSGTRWALWRWSLVDSDYIRRLHLVKTPWFAVCLHWILRPDPERHLHDHPVSFLSLILRGWYAESRGLGGFCVRRRWWNYLRASRRDVHAIRYVSPGGALTLCLMGPKRQEWCFHTERGLIHWKDYHGAQRLGLDPGEYARTWPHD